MELGVNSNPTGSGPGSIGTFFPFTRTSTRLLPMLKRSLRPRNVWAAVERALEGHLGPLPGVHAHVGRGAGGHADHHAPRRRGRRLRARSSVRSVRGVVSVVVAAARSSDGSSSRAQAQGHQARDDHGRPSSIAMIQKRGGPPARLALAARRADRLEGLQLVARLVLGAVLLHERVRVEPEQLRVGPQERLDERGSQAASRTPRSRAPAGTSRGSSSAARHRRCRGADACGPRAASHRWWASASGPHVPL